MNNLFKSITFLSLFSLINGAITIPALAQSPDDALGGIEGCSSWKDKGGQACDFRYGNHDFRIWKPQVSQAGVNTLVIVKFDHKLSRRPDDHWYLNLVNQSGQCSAKLGQETRGVIPGFRFRLGDERGWEYALVSVIRSVAFQYGCVDVEGL
jgi:hypothetical protein